jgi:SnoaL-like domain
MSAATKLYAEINALLNAHEYDAIYERMHPDHRQFLNGVLAADGKEATRAADEVFYMMLPDLRRVTHDIFGTEDRATCRSTFVGTLADGRSVELPVGSIIGTVRNFV